MPPADSQHHSFSEARGASARAAVLIAGFYDDPRRFGSCRDIPAAEVPEPARGLLDHRSHMTVVMEGFVGGAVNLQVLQENAVAASAYSREILLLAAAGDGVGSRGPVQYGIVRIDLQVLPEAAASRIRRQESPLGRILIEAGVLREVRDVALLEIVVGDGLAAATGRPAGSLLYGRVASISLADAASTKSVVSPYSQNPARPAIELLEIPIV